MANQRFVDLLKLGNTDKERIRIDDMFPTLKTRCTSEVIISIIFLWCV